MSKHTAKSRHTPEMLEDELLQDELNNDVVPLHRCKSLISLLMSTTLHLMTLAVLTLILVGVDEDQPLDLQFSVADLSSADESFETFQVADLPTSEVAETDVSQFDSVVLPSEPAAFEPELVDLGDIAVGSQDEVASSNSEAPAGVAAPITPLPSARSGSFFGTNAYGDEFVFVVDSSRSMLSTCGYRQGETRFQVACKELLRSIGSLEADQKFCVFFFGHRTRVMFDKSPQLVNATETNRKRLKSWISTLYPGMGTDPRYGIMHALRLKPDAVFLLSDGEFNGQATNFHQIPGNPSTERIIKRHLGMSIPIHTIAFEDLVNRRRLRNIATVTHGTHKFIGSQTETSLLLADLSSNQPVDVLYASRQIVEDARILSEESANVAGGLLAKLLGVNNLEVQESAHHALLAIAQEFEIDMSAIDELGDSPTSNEYRAAQAMWSALLADHFRNIVSSRFAAF